MKNKSINFIISLSLSMILGLSSCDNWLELVPESSITTASMWKSPDDAKAGLNGAFNRFRSAFGINYNHWGDKRCNFYFGRVLPSNTTELENNQLSSSSVATNWSGLYIAINACNLVLKYVPDIKFTIEDDKSQILASAYYLRAMMYFYIGRIWGDAPVLVDGFESDSQTGLYPTRQPASDVFNQVEQDLIKALELVKDGTTPYQVTREAICMLQTDLYLWLAKVYQKGTDALNKADAAVTVVLNSGKDMEASYETVFRNDASPELIFSIAIVENEFTLDFLFLHTVNEVPAEYRNNPVPVLNQQRSTITDEHKDFLWGTPNDSRANINVAEFTVPETGVTYRWINKYLGTLRSGTRIPDSDIPVYRFAEALLFKAEIEIARNNIPGALPYINRIAKRAYGEDNYYSGIYSQDEIENILVDERLKELSSEGKSWFDLIRLGQAFKRIETLKGRENEQNILLWPVNIGSINSNPAITQTPGYY